MSGTKYLWYVEKVRKHLPLLKRLAKEASQSAINNAHSKNIPVAYIEDGWIIKEYPDGTKEKYFKLNGGTMK